MFRFSKLYELSTLKLNENFRMATKLAIQQERAKKRAERQKVKLERLKRKEQKMKRKMRKSKDSLAECNHMYSKLNCYQHDNDHWKTPPLWHGKSSYQILHSIFVVY